MRNASCCRPHGAAAARRAGRARLRHAAAGGEQRHLDAAERLRPSASTTSVSPPNGPLAGRARRRQQAQPPQREAGARQHRQQVLADGAGGADDRHGAGAHGAPRGARSQLPDLPPDLCSSRTSLDRRAAADGLGHVVERQRRHRRGGQRLHLDAGGRDRARLGDDADARRRRRGSKSMRDRATAAADGTAGSAAPCPWRPGCRRCAPRPAPRPLAAARAAALAARRRARRRRGLGAGDARVGPCRDTSTMRARPAGVDVGQTTRLRRDRAAVHGDGSMPTRGTAWESPFWHRARRATYRLPTQPPAVLADGARPACLHPGPPAGRPITASVPTRDLGALHATEFCSTCLPAF